MTGILYIVATPIGNLRDISERALDSLKNVDLIAAEDTRHSKKLLQHFTINKTCIAYHEHNEEQLTKELIDKLQAGDSIALISDAGTPLINDPGYRLVSAAHDHQVKVVPIPGPSALITALSASGLTTNKFIFEGYPPVKAVARLKYLQELTDEQRTLIFYEAPHRIQGLIKSMLEAFGEDRLITLARELSKQFEQIVRDSLINIDSKLNNNEITIKGEFVVIAEGAKTVPGSDSEILRINRILSEKLSAKDAAVLTAKITGRKKNETYQLALKTIEKQPKQPN